MWKHICLISNEGKRNTILIETEGSAPAEIFTTDIKGTNQLEVNADELNKDKVEDHQD